jgi:gliding motility-associated-like protein
MKIQIYSRWGNLVFQGEPNGWDGMYNGANLPDGAYFYVLDFGDGTTPESGYLVISR